MKRIECRRSKSDEASNMQLEQSYREIRILNSRAHDNILAIYAFSFGGEFPCLVYQFMPNGSLEDWLRCKNDRRLSWLQRFEVAKGTARGMQYLHTIGDRPLIHGDIKTANVLLDKNLEVKIGDFGLAREGLKGEDMMVKDLYETCLESMFKYYVTQFLWAYLRYVGLFHNQKHKKSKLLNIIVLEIKFRKNVKKYIVMLYKF